MSIMLRLRNPALTWRMQSSLNKMFLENLRLCLECQKENTMTGALRVPSEPLLFFSFQIWPFVGRQGQIWGKAQEMLLGQRSSLKGLWMFPLKIRFALPPRVLPKLGIMKSVNHLSGFIKLGKIGLVCSVTFPQDLKSHSYQKGVLVPDILTRFPGPMCGFPLTDLKHLHSIAYVLIYTRIYFWKNLLLRRFYRFKYGSFINMF